MEPKPNVPQPSADDNKHTYTPRSAHTPQPCDTRIMHLPFVLCPGPASVLCLIFRPIFLFHLNRLLSCFMRQRMALYAYCCAVCSAMPFDAIVLVLVVRRGEMCIFGIEIAKRCECALAERVGSVWVSFLLERYSFSCQSRGFKGHAVLKIWRNVIRHEWYIFKYVWICYVCVRTYGPWPLTVHVT